MPCWQPRPQTHLEETPLLPEILPFYPLRLVWGWVWRGIAVEAPRATSMKSGSYVLTIPFALSCFVKNDRWIATVARAGDRLCAVMATKQLCKSVRGLRTLVRRYARGLRVLRRLPLQRHNHKPFPSLRLLGNMEGYPMRGPQTSGIRF